MNSPTTTLSAPNPNTLRAILWGGLLCGVLDITAALVVYGYMGAKPLRLLQGIAGGLLGPRTYSGGGAAGFLGLFCHFLVGVFSPPVLFTSRPPAPLLIPPPGL